MTSLASDDDEFFDQTMKKSSQKSNEQQSAETADSLLEKKDSITSDIENKKKLLEGEEHKLAKGSTADLGDCLDACMSGLSSQLVHDKIAQIQKEPSDLQADAEEPDNSVDCKDRKAILSNSCSGNELEEAAPGLILLKRKSTDQSASSEADSSSVESEASIADAVALLLKHKRGLQTLEEMENEDEPHASKKNGKQRRVLGPARPDILEAGPGSETWMPPEGQTGDGHLVE